MKKNNFWERINKNFNKNKFVLFVFAVIWGLTVFVTLNHYKDTLGKESVGNELYPNVVELTEKTDIKQIIPVEDIDHSESICIKFATYARANEGQVYVRVVGMDTKTIYANRTVDVNEVQDNAFFTINFTKDLLAEEERNVMVHISANSVEGKGMAMYYSNEKCFEGSSLTINSKTMEGDLTIRFLTTDEDLSMFNTAVVSWLVTIITVLIVVMLLVEPKPEVLFALIALTFGLTYLIVITPMSVPDETVHYEYSFQLSNYMMGQGDTHRIFNEEYQNYGSFAGHLNISAAYVRFVKRINKPLSLRPNDVKMPQDINESYTTCFIPQALGITLARLLNQNMLRTFYIGRIFNLLFYVGCVYLAVKRTPVHKLLFGLLATCPIFMQQAASYSYDCWINGFTLLVISSLLKWIYQEEKITLKDFIFVFFVNMMIAPIKVVYSLFTICYIFVPVSKYKDKKWKILGTLVILGPAIYELTRLMFPLIFRAVRKFFENVLCTGTTTMALSESANTLGAVANGAGGFKPFYEGGETYTFSYVINHPYESFILFARTIRYFIKFWFYGAMGRTLSGDSLILPVRIVHVLTAVIFLAAFKKEKYVESIFLKVFYLGLCVMAGLMMLGGMLISWTEIDQVIIEDFGGPVIQGIQGRYFSPLLPYFFSIFNNKKFGLPDWVDKYLIFTFFIVVFEVIIYVLSYTYIN